MDDGFPAPLIDQLTNWQSRLIDQVTALPNWQFYAVGLVVAVHLLSVTIMWMFAGWYRLMRKFPDRDGEEPMQRLRLAVRDVW